MKLDLGGDSGHLASLFISRSIHEFGFLVNVYLHSHMGRIFFPSIHPGQLPKNGIKIYFML